MLIKPWNLQQIINTFLSLGELRGPLDVAQHVDISIGSREGGVRLIWPSDPLGLQGPLLIKMAFV